MNVDQLRVEMGPAETKSMPVRAAKENDLPRLQDIERAAGVAFAQIGMQLVADDDPPSINELKNYQAAGHAWVVVDDRDIPVAYLTAQEVDSCVHIDQVSVHPQWAHRRIGQRLLRHLLAWAAERRYPAVTLTTFRDVAWNGPYYQRRGFCYLGDSEITPGLRHIRTEEADKGLDAWPRACMRYEIQH